MVKSESLLTLSAALRKTSNNPTSVQKYSPILHATLLQQQHWKSIRERGTSNYLGRQSRLGHFLPVSPALRKASAKAPPPASGFPAFGAALIFFGGIWPFGAPDCCRSPSPG